MNLLICILLSVTITKISGGGQFECDTDANCAPSTAKCVDQVCQCPSGQIFTIDNIKCIDLAKKYNGKCEIDEQCAIFGGPIACRDGSCQCPVGYVFFRRRCIRKLVNTAECSTDEDCFDGLDYFSRVCQEKKCQCASGYYNRANVDCRKEAALREPCALTLDCQDEGAICEGKICIQNGTASGTTYHNLYTDEDDGDEDYVLSNPLSPRTDGIALNSTCKPGDPCADAHALCSPITRTCFCRNGYAEIRHKNGDRACLAELGMTCNAQTDCVPGSLCEKGICTCAVGKHYDATNAKCRMAAYQLGDILACNNKDSCRALNTHYFCDPTERTKYCRCESGFALSDASICEISCLSSADCLNEHEICDEFSKCVCDDEYKMVDGRCKPRIGGACSNDKECLDVVAASHCDMKKSVCACNKTFVSSNFDCYPETGVGKQCLVNDQCLWKSNSSCVPDNMGRTYCECDAGFRNVGGNCLRIATRIGDYCTHPSVCLADSICAKSKCTCTKGLKASKDLRMCLGKTSDSSSSTILTPLAIIYAVSILFSYR